MLVFIIGASRGIGASAAESFAKKGCDLFITARNTEQLAELSAKLTNKYHIKCGYSAIDVTRQDTISQAANQCLEDYGTPSIVLHNSGISKSDNFLEFEAQIIRDIYDVNVFGIMNSMEIFIPILLNGEGGIFVGVTSLAEARGIPGNAGYTSSKIAASHLLEAARCQLMNSKVKIATIKPGFVQTDMTSRNAFPMPFLLSSERAGEIIAERLLGGRLRISFPYSTAFLSWCGKLIPGFIYDGLMKHWKKRKI